ncbi:S66 peptidase family protein [Capnocytophaga catalasegens]|uniref:Peptidase S66 n=1 Tax=Capnocytophaga catalasegens TaxID=1004260 RepID=A0AAV5AXJ7_9FLAO|nr:LD-carboxypeptidase [Capnocytophaga catalasegens]GIZ16458.1 peptidase S66 [Capnocytophaga catalasegens]GJM50303.1 peptidase S66 [Capnocytophaga catalasegens]GJM53820.1 peptidase S66 [Capnocytophaga catalasegens]
MKTPFFLKENDSVGIISTARSISYQEILPAIEWLQSIGLQPVIGKTIGLSHHQFAGTDTERLADLQEMLDNPQINAIWCARGGYGTARLLDFIDFSHFLKNPKWILGYSDVTALHAHLSRLGIASTHCTMPINVAKNTKESLLSLKNFLFGSSNQYQWENSQTFYENCHIEGEIIGGNLSIIYSLLGSKSSICSEGKILFIEDLDEYLYHIDRMILNLKRNGVLSRLKALLVGNFSQMHDNNIPFGKSVEEIILEHCQEYNYPIIFNVPTGHIDDNRPLVFGKKVELFIKNNVSTLCQNYK